MREGKREQPAVSVVGVRVGSGLHAVEACTAGDKDAARDEAEESRKDLKKRRGSLGSLSYKCSRHRVVDDDSL